MVVGAVVLILFAFVASQINGDGSPSTFLVFLAFTLGMSGVAVLITRLFQARGDLPVKRRLTKTQIAILAGITFFAVFAAVDASRSDTFLAAAAASVADFVIGPITIGVIVLATGLVKRLRHPRAQ